MKVSCRSTAIDRGKRAGLISKQLDQLGRRTTEINGRELGIIIVPSQAIEGFSQQCGVVFVSRIDHKFAASATGFPQVARRDLGRTTYAQRQQETKPEQGLFSIPPLRSEFIGLGNQTCRTVVQDHGRLDLVAILATRTRSTSKRLVALGEQACRVNCSGMQARHELLIDTFNSVL